MSEEYKLLKDFGEIVPGMVFENYVAGSFLIIHDKKKDEIIFSFSGNASMRIHDDFRRRQLDLFFDKYKLIRDPRKGTEMTIEEKIADHKKQIEILEKELKENKLKNIFVSGKIYKIKVFNEDSIVCKLNLNTNQDVYNKKTEIFMECLNERFRIFTIKRIQKVWLIENIDDLFNSNKLIFERT